MLSFHHPQMRLEYKMHVASAQRITSPEMTPLILKTNFSTILEDFFAL